MFKPGFELSSTKIGHLATVDNDKMYWWQADLSSYLAAYHVGQVQLPRQAPVAGQLIQILLKHCTLVAEPNVTALPFVHVNATRC
jgi:hypothetical protein